MPSANFLASNTSIVEGDNVTFSYTGLIGEGIASWQWDFGDGTPNGTTGAPVHQYTIPGNYTVTLTVADHAGQPSTCTRVAFVSVAEGPDDPGEPPVDPPLDPMPWIAATVIAASAGGAVATAAISRAKRRRASS